MIIRDRRARARNRMDFTLLDQSGIRILGSAPSRMPVAPRFRDSGILYILEAIFFCNSRGATAVTRACQNDDAAEKLFKLLIHFSVFSMILKVTYKI